MDLVNHDATDYLRTGFQKLISKVLGQVCITGKPLVAASLARNGVSKRCRTPREWDYKKRFWLAGTERSLETSKVPPPRSNTRIVSFFFLSSPYARLAAVGSLMMRITSRPAIRPASCKAEFRHVNWNHRVAGQKGGLSILVASRRGDMV